MPVKMVQRGPTVVSGSCPTCNHPVKVRFYENRGVGRFFCNWCGQWITAELKDGQLVVSTKDASYTPVRRDETCPNEKCGAKWELWFHPNGALSKPHGASFVASNHIRCNTCGTYADVSLD